MGKLRERLLADAVIGSPETVARQLASWAIATSCDGICLALYDFEASLELLAEHCLEPSNALAAAGKGRYRWSDSQLIERPAEDLLRYSIALDLDTPAGDHPTLVRLKT